MSERRNTPLIRQRPHFIWNADLTEQDVRQILAGDDEHERARMIGHIYLITLPSEN